MPKCCVKGCGMKYGRKSSRISLHKLPKNESLKQKWLESLGQENIDCTQKTTFVCSLHFKEHCFNRTLDVVRLQEHAIPTPFSQEVVKSKQVALSTVDLNIQPSTSEKEVVKSERVAFSTVDLNIQQSTSEKEVVKSERVATVDFNVQPSTSETFIPLVEKLKEKCNQQKKKIKRLNEKCRRQAKKLADFSNIINDLKKRKFINNEGSIVLEECSGPKDFLKRQLTKSRGLPLEKTYSEEIRKFALTLQFLSPSAYSFIRRTYNSCLPHPRTLSKWYQKVNAEPGFTKEAFDTLKLKAQMSETKILCTLVIDEMSIRKSLTWDPVKQKFYGRVDMGVGFDSDSLDEASQCLVFLLTAINGSWKLPVGYFFITSLTSEQKCQLVRICLQMTEDTGVSIVALTCDGLASNFSMLELLGCKNIASKPDVTTFAYGASVVNVFIDPCHTLKLVRNAFGELKTFYDAQNRKINYEYIENLHQLQEKQHLHLATKLTKAHIDFFKQKMKVRLATQLLSNSVADALEYCEEKLKLPAFQDCSGTINFIRTMNNIFDILNSHSVRPPGWKKAMCESNIGLCREFLSYAEEYINLLRLPSGQLLINSRRKTGFNGLIIDIKSSLSLYKKLVEENKMLKYIPFYKISQDHLELFFSSIRARGGFNNNPNAVQFTAAYKRLLIRAEIREHGVGNCIPLEQINILTCSSYVSPIKNINNLTEHAIYATVSEDDSELYEDFLDVINNNSLNEYTESVLEYIGGFIARKLSRLLKCESCISLLTSNKTNMRISLVNIKTLGGLIYPSKSVLHILKKTEQLLKLKLKSSIKSENYYLYIYKFVIDFFETKDIFTFNMEHDTIHKLLLIKSVIKCYLDIRFKYYGKKMTEKITLRNYLNKTVLFRNE